MGKALGLFFGIMIGGQLGPLGFMICVYFGYKIGKSFDQNKTKRHRTSKAHYDHFNEFTRHFYGSTFNPQIPTIPFFGILGHIAKSDGVVRSSQIRLAEEIMQRLNLQDFSRTQAIHSFRRGKSARFDFEQALTKVYQATINHFSVRQLLFKWMLEMAQLGPYGLQQKKLLNQAATVLGIQAYSQVDTSTGTDVNSAHSILGTSPSDSKDAIKKTYRKLLGQYHPDRLPLDATEEQKTKAAEKMIAIKKAYETISKNMRGYS
jgi:DnaJ like chaperone protein